MPGGGLLMGGAAGGVVVIACWFKGGGGSTLATGGGGLGTSIGLHCSTLFLRSASSAASCTLSFFSSDCASSSEAFRRGVGSGGGGGAGGASVSSVATLVVGSTGAQARSSHEAMSNIRSSSRPKSKAPHQRDQPSRAGRAMAGAL